MSPGGRPTKFKPEFVEQAENYALLGATDVELASFFHVSDTTIANWKNAHPEFVEALNRGKAVADAMVAKSLFQRAIGYTCKDTKIMQYEGNPVTVEYDRHYPPDVTAQIFWLKNRRPDLWRDKHDMNVVGDVKHGVLMVPMPIDAADWDEQTKASQSRLVGSAGDNGNGSSAG